MRTTSNLFLYTFATLILTICGLSLHAQGHSLPEYVPAPVKIPTGASYLQSDGTVLIVGADSMEAVLKKWDALFEKTHPGVRFKLLLKGSSTGIGGLTAGVSALAPMGREAWESDLRPFRFVYGYPPTDILVGHSGYAAAGRVSPPGIYVNSKNPLPGLTVAQVARIFTSGDPAGDISQWSQLDMTGRWAARTIHLYGPRDDGGFATSLRTRLMGGHAFASRYEPAPKFKDVIQAVSEDPYAMGLVGFYDSTQLPKNVRMLPLSMGNGSPDSSASYTEVMDGRYPFEPALHIYVNRAPGEPMGGLVKEYLLLVLSRQGQQAIAEEKGSSNGCVPLSVDEVMVQRRKLF